MKFLGQGFQKLGNKQDRQRDRHRQTDATESITIALVGGKNITHSSISILFDDVLVTFIKLLTVLPCVMLLMLKTSVDAVLCMYPAVVQWPTCIVMYAGDNSCLLYTSPSPRD